MTEHGACLDALNPAAAPEPSTYPFAWARLVAFDDERFYAYCDALTAAGVKLALVLGAETFGDGDRSLIAEHLAIGVPSAALWVIGNEQDAGLLGVPSPASWAMTPAEFADLWGAVVPAIRAVQPSAKLVLGGFVSGQVDALIPYLQAIEAQSATPIGPDGFDLHPYGKDADATYALINGIREATWAAGGVSLATYVLEWNRPAAEIPDYTGMLDGIVVSGACWFAWSDGQSDEPMGLVDASGAPKAELAALRAAVSKVEVAQPMASGDIHTGPASPDMLAAIKAAGDTCLNPQASTYQTGVDGSLVEIAYGTKGEYYATNASGQWVRYGPFPGPAA